MTEGLRQHLPTIIAVTLIGLATGVFALIGIHNSAKDMDLGSFNTLIFLIPCAIMLIGSILITVTASEVGRQLYLVVVAICLVAGIVAMVVTSAWMSEPAIAEALFVNSGSVEPVIPPVQSPLIVLRDIAAFVVVPTVGCIAGVWIGSRLHPVSSAKGTKKPKRKNSR